MPWMAQRIELSERQRELLERIVRRRTESQRVAQRARIVVLAADGQSNRAISGEVGLERHQVGLWRNRWLEHSVRLAAAESESDQNDLEELLRDALSDEPRSGCPPKFTAEQVTRIIAVACEEPEESDRPVSHWTSGELAAEVIKRGIVPEISPRQVGRFLK
ncbi:MAG: helix-turn-helix domain-containing protein [Planctomycetes bacterium]|nr:helix-turn-helix domain-containing protein [Planctomycetota bacterium]